eukprot:7129083-Prymnesium_polylepis.1
MASLESQRARPTSGSPVTIDVGRLREWFMCSQRYRWDGRRAPSRLPVSLSVEPFYDPIYTQ